MDHKINQVMYQYHNDSMINRTKINNSLYDILSEDPKTITEYRTKQSKKTQKQLQKEEIVRNKKSNISDINLNENISNQDTNPSNQVIVHTKEDNLVHNYFHSFSLYWDAGDPLSGTIIKLPKMDTENTKYWITHNGEITIYLGNEINKQLQQQNNNNSTSTTSYYNLKGMLPIFRGEVGHIKEYQKVLEIHIDSIGKRFKQKIPDEFRQAYIYNQNVRDAFQAICEFLGVKYICPPAELQPQDGEQENEDPQGDGTENNVNDKTAQEQQLAQAASNIIKKAQDNQNNDANNNTGNDENQNTDSQVSLNESTNQSDIQNGYSDISFDANGAIVHGSVTIETSPNMAETLIALDQHPLDKYLEDTTYVATDVEKFLNGEMFDTVHNSVLNYDSITIEPKSAESSDMSSINSIGGENASEDEENSDSEASKKSQDLLSKSKSGITLNGIKMVQNKQSMTYDQVNKLTPLQARNEMTKTNLYYNTTILRLRARARGYVVNAGTPYWKFKNG